MKRKLLTFLITFIGLSVYAQTFTCPEFDNDFALWQRIHEKYKLKSTGEWARHACDSFPVNIDKCIECRYIVQSKDSFNLSDMEDYLSNWIKLEFKNASPVVDHVTHTVNAKGTIYGIGSHMGFYSYSSINCEINVSVTLKEKRMRIIVTIPHYSLGSSSLGGVESKLHLIGDCYPINKNSDHRASYAMAFINANANCFNKVKSLISFLNKHKNDVSSDGDDNW